MVVEGLYCRIRSHCYYMQEPKTTPIVATYLVIVNNPNVDTTYNFRVLLIRETRQETSTR